MNPQPVDDAGDDELWEPLEPDVDPPPQLVLVVDPATGAEHLVDDRT